ANLEVAGRSISIVSRGGIGSVHEVSHRGLQLTDEIVDASSWHDSSWTEQHIRFRVPPNWIAKQPTQRELDWRADEKFYSTYLTASARLWDRDLPAANLIDSDLRTASENLRNGVILGYGPRVVGGADGVLTISFVGDREVITWMGIAGGSEQ